MRRHSLIGLFLCVFAIWAQVLAPVAAEALVQTDPLAGAVLCTHGGSTDGGTTGSHDGPAHGHYHCLLCQACIGGGLIPERPAFTALDHPVASPLRWRLVAPAPKIARARGPGQPRGPPVLA